MESNVGSFEERIQPFLHAGWDLEPVPYRIRNADGTPGPWKSKVHIYRHMYTETRVLPVWGSRKYTKHNEAQWGAVLMGLQWLEENA
jgi:hypothetical protein